MSKLLLLSNSTMPGTSFFTWPKPYVTDFLGKDVHDVCFIPFAAVKLSFDDYAQTVSQAFVDMGYNVTSIHNAGDKRRFIEEASCIVVGGGNTFALLNRIYEHDLLEVIRGKVREGTPYIGWSAGANIASPSLKTTNDMPVIMPPSFEALNLVPFQINPHYHELRFENQGGETRRERLEEFLVMNQEATVVGLPEGMFIRRDGKRLIIGGQGTAKLYTYGKPVEDIHSGADVGFLLRV